MALPSWLLMVPDCLHWEKHAHTSSVEDSEDYCLFYHSLNSLNWHDSFISDSQPLSPQCTAEMDFCVAVAHVLFLEVFLKFSVNFRKLVVYLARMPNKLLKYPKKRRKWSQREVAKSNGECVEINPRPTLLTKRICFYGSPSSKLSQTLVCFLTTRVFKSSSVWSV